MTLVMGILNVTPDSFSDGGLWHGPDAAVAQGIHLANEGADIVDVGGESTRPGAERVPADEELARVIPVIRELAAAGITTSIDTMRAATARAAVEAGATIVNDVSGGLADPAMATTVAGLDVDFIAMHWRAHSTHMDALDVYDDVVADVHNELVRRVHALQDAGIANDRIIVDPGLGFSKVGDSNWALLANLDVLRGMGNRILIGASRKRFLGAAIGRPDAPPTEREAATTAVTALAAASGIWGIRVHDARAARDAVAVVDAWQNATFAPE
ncbi:dihydropteroate synthase [Demequina sp.]|uniref:dihydropteroate synthase n=1 Tax=Demequina sp. TaxID=2050685 RepID=UPI003D0A5D6B